MTPLTKALVLAGTAAMVLSPMVAGAAGSTLPVLAQGASPGGDDGKGLGALTIGAIALGLGLGGLLVAGGSGGSEGSGGAKPQSN